MPKNKGKGGKNRRRGKNVNEEKRELLLKEDGQEYAVVLKMLGNNRVRAECFDEKRTKRLCKIRGKMRLKQWIEPGGIILVALRSFEDDKADVIARYSTDEARDLKKLGELPSNTMIVDPSSTTSAGSADGKSVGGEGKDEDEAAFDFENI